MDLTILGCRSGMPADGQASSGYLVTAGDTRLLLDCGPGVATALSTVTEQLTAVVISHMHLDHCYDLLPVGKTLLSAGLRYPAPGMPPQTELTIPRLPLYVPKGATTVFDRLAALFPVSTVPALDRAFELAFDVREYSPGDVFTVGATTITLHLLEHASPNCGIRVDGPDGSLAYTGDTGRTPALDELADHADLLLAECTLREPDPGPHGHLCAEDAAEVADRAEAGQLVLTHFSTADPQELAASQNQAAKRFAGPVHVAEPGRTFPVRKAQA